MIQSGKFDSSKMDIKKLANSVLIFTIKRIIEIIGVFTFCLGILLFLALASYSPSDPNFIFPENTEIKNLLGFRGSYTSDLFLQSVGLIAFLIPVTYIFTGINIFKKKELFLFIENTFFIILYILVGSLFFNFFYENSFTFYVNGNGGFVGSYLKNITPITVIKSYENIFYYTFIFLIILIFLKSINFSIKNFFQYIKKIIQIIFRKNTKNYTNQNEVINEYIPQEEIKNLIQDDLPFIKAEANTSTIKKKFKLPSIDLLKFPKKK